MQGKPCIPKAFSKTKRRPFSSLLAGSEERVGIFIEINLTQAI